MLIVVYSWHRWKSVNMHIKYDTAYDVLVKPKFLDVWWWYHITPRLDLKDVGRRALTRTQTQPWPFPRLAHRWPGVTLRTLRQPVWRLFFSVGGPDLAVGSSPKVPTIQGASFHSISCVLAMMEVLKSSKVQFYLVIMSIIQVFKS